MIVSNTPQYPAVCLPKLLVHETPTHRARVSDRGQFGKVEKKIVVCRRVPGTSGEFRPTALLGTHAADSAEKTVAPSCGPQAMV